MKKISALIIMFIFSPLVQAHVLPLPMYSELPKSEYWYVRIIPSPIMEGFASYELCPLIQDHNKDQFLIFSEKQKLDMGNYHHDLIHPQCQRPYQISSRAPSVYFDMRDLDRVLSIDEELEAIKTIGVVGVSMAAMWATGGLVAPALAGWVTSAAVGFGAGELTDVVLDHAIPIEMDMLQFTRIEYFTGAHGRKGQDLQWPILPEDVLTCGECYRSCDIERKKSQDAAEKMRKEEKKRDLLQISPLVLKPTESITNQNPLNHVDTCAYQCRGLPTERPSVKKLWKDLFLKTIYEAGNQNYIRKGPEQKDMTGADKNKLFEVYHDEKRMDWSAWVTARDILGKPIANHFTHRSNVEHTGHHYTKRYHLCDHMRLVSFEKYRSLGGKLKLDQWMETKCSYDKSQRCRDFFDSEVQTGNEICTVLSED
jgi:hypothetical protein